MPTRRTTTGTTRYIVSTFCTRVGRPNTPTSATQGGWWRGGPRLSNRKTPRAAIGTALAGMQVPAKRISTLWRVEGVLPADGGTSGTAPRASRGVMTCRVSRGKSWSRSPQRFPSPFLRCSPSAVRLGTSGAEARGAFRHLPQGLRACAFSVLTPSPAPRPPGSAAAPSSTGRPRPGRDRRWRHRSSPAPAPRAAVRPKHYSNNQFSTRRPVTRENSRVFAVTTVRSSARACAAMSRSLGPIGVP